jgi:hypothetical protein
VNLGASTEAISTGIEGMSAMTIRKVNCDSQSTGSSIPCWSSTGRSSLPLKSLPLLFPPTVQVPSHLAYIKWFSPFPLAPDQHHGLYKVLQSLLGGAKLASIVPLSKIVHSAHLIPNFGAIVPQEWSSDTVLDDCNTFWLKLISR